MEYIYKKPNPLSVGSCLLNSHYPNKGPARGQHTCYRYGAECAYRSTLVPVKDQWDSNFVCPKVAKFRCTTSYLFECPNGYYPVCGDVPGTGFKRYNNVTYDACAQKCNEFAKCTGMEWFYRKNWYNQGTCFLNDKYATKPRYPGQHSCYRYGAPCPGKNWHDRLPAYVWNDNRSCPKGYDLLCPEFRDFTNNLNVITDAVDLHHKSKLAKALAEKSHANNAISAFKKALMKIAHKEKDMDNKEQKLKAKVVLDKLKAKKDKDKSENEKEIKKAYESARDLLKKEIKKDAKCEAKEMNKKVTTAAIKKQLNKKCTLTVDCENKPEFAKLLKKLGKSLKKLYKWQNKMRDSLDFTKKTSLYDMMFEGRCSEMCYNAPNPIKGMDVRLFNALVSSCKIGTDFKSY